MCIFAFVFCTITPGGEKMRTIRFYEGNNNEAAGLFALSRLYRRTDPLLSADEELRMGLEEHTGEYRSESDVRRVLKELEMRR